MESSADKTKRKLIKLIEDHAWKYQTSIFVDVLPLELEEAKVVAVEWLKAFDDVKFRDYLRKKHRDTAMIYMLRKTQHRKHESGKSFQQVYVTIFSNTMIDCTREKVNEYVANYDLNIISRKLTSAKIESTCRALRNQGLHNLSNLGDKKRYSVLNKRKCISIQPTVEIKGSA